jgi:hypothetical protein
MFDTLTDDERHALNCKLADWAHSFHLVGHTLARVALIDHDPDSVLWDKREPYIEARAELVALRAELAA